MMLIAALLRPWACMVRSQGSIPKLLADDVLILTVGQGMVKRYAKCLDATHSYFQDMGASISIPKSFNFSNVDSARKWLERNTFKKTFFRNFIA